jgi:hypothetical protein
MLLLRGSEIICAPDDQILVGVTLSIIHKACYQRGLDIVRRHVTVIDFLTCDGVVMTGTSVGALPVAELVVGYWSDAPHSEGPMALAQRLRESLGDDGWTAVENCVELSRVSDGTIAIIRKQTAQQPLYVAIREAYESQLE